VPGKSYPHRSIWEDRVAQLFGNGMRHITRAVSLALIVLGGLAGTPASAATLQNLYNGHLHHNAVALLENEPATLTVGAVQPNGHFTATLLDVPITGKATSAGKVTFSGSFPLMGGGTAKVKDGKGQLSATGLHLLGAFKITGDASVNSLNGEYTFDLHTAENAPPAGRVHSNAGIGQLGADYAGHSHSVISAANENLSLDMPITGTQANGKFTGKVGDLPISGKVTSKGKVTFSGKLTVGDITVRIKNGKGQLSATGAFLLGTLTISGTLTQNGNFTYETENQP
jgi:hypothetical protein